VEVAASQLQTQEGIEWPPDALLELHAHFPQRYPVLLESIGGGEAIGRHDLLLALPGEQLRLTGELRLEGREPQHDPEPRFLAALDAWWRRASAPCAAGERPFAGGWFLYLAYELAGQVEPSLRLPRSRRPAAIAWRMHAAIVRDHRTGRARIAGEPAAARDLGRSVQRDLAELAAAPRRSPAADLVAVSGAVQEEDPQRYLRVVGAALEAIARGDVYQANLSRRWRARLVPGMDEVELYRRLRAANPAPFAGIARLPGFSVLSSSPERLLRIDEGVASTRPIAGTRPRGGDPQADARLRSDLRLNEKERAEHVMLVDLERNDLGRICRAGTVRVDEFMTIESYAHVHHIVSNVRGDLAAGVTPGQAIAAVFPGGTITGCPKVRCMQLLADLEGSARDAYTGSMGYLGLDGSLDLNILIRTITVEDGVIDFRTGAGIVADSSPQAELEETRAKARGLLRALGSDA
jgi:anthranilate synthase component 1